MRIGVAAPERTARAFAGRLQQLGHQVSLWDREMTPGRPACTRAPCAFPCVIAEHPEDLLARSDLVITVLDAARMVCVYEGTRGLLAGDIGAKIIVEMGELPPDTEIRLARQVRERGGVFVECPTAGTLADARAGRLIGFAAGPADDLARARPVLEQMCARIEHQGDNGTGAAAKLRHSAPIFCF